MKKFDKVVWGMVGCGAVTEKWSRPIQIRKFRVKSSI